MLFFIKNNSCRLGDKDFCKYGITAHGKAWSNLQRQIFWSSKVRKFAYISILAILLFGAFLAGVYTSEKLHRLDPVLKKFDDNIKYSRQTKQLIDIIISSIKKNPQETIFKLENLQKEINISYEYLPMDTLLSKAGFETNDKKYEQGK